MSLYNDLVRHEFGKGATIDELEGIQNRMNEAVSGLLLGISAIGSLMFWATDNDNYTEETAKGDMRKIGAMLGTVGEVVRALNDTSENAAAFRSDCMKGSKVREGRS
ncbi:TPA: ubiquinol-cytochrome C reductase [Klebsiella pneumoniae]|uniref:ubiquinol-cytochrome C reductase n=1 Tax=Klebsiella pneumoniae TaxID=573 RepID=UPI00259F2148|nr:ubiquinol-cytochrome C reductase [Klebsiella pneumoniae]EKV5224738.1 ubiquinol-cytochrome C reductase [Klebsiella pneumoniae]MDY7149396.1 ubiquinol-cytochrome C reductase [Klebsiella pneumoniae]HBR5683992.1 ubiquinol-cytochrome C reductase [Klebsiella pneumoniae]HBR5700865.1 ubiquinol-cytochrome C reductase [Klebsiella pneumoniae]HBT4948624.1 ubiquinol-cytochrome C reductase [Klebsiella pneumoniae]